MKSTPRSPRTIATALVLSLLGGTAFLYLHVPLPWMLGPLFFVGLAAINGAQVADIRGARQAGQLIIGCGLGLYFTPTVTRQLLDYGVYILAAALIGILVGASSSVVLRRFSGMAPSTAFFASVPGGATEMAILAERTGARFDQVVLCHSLRVLLTVSIIPLAVTLTGASGSSIYAPLAIPVQVNGLLPLIALAAASSWLFMKAGVPNAWILGSLFSTTCLTLNGIALSAVPSFLTVLAQLFIGCTLGTRFKPSLRSESRSLLKGVAAGAVCTLSLSALLGLAIAGLTGESAPAMVLATSPGGIAEMCLTAKVLKLGVPLVTAFQVARMAIVLTCSLPIWRLLERFAAWRAQRRAEVGED